VWVSTISGGETRDGDFDVVEHPAETIVAVMLELDTRTARAGAPAQRPGGRASATGNSSKTPKPSAGLEPATPSFGASRRTACDGLRQPPPVVPVDAEPALPAEIARPAKHRPLVLGPGAVAVLAACSTRARSDANGGHRH
jgi:hypothetical protein